MPDNRSCFSTAPCRTPWNKGKLIGAKPPLRSKHAWSIRTRLLGTNPINAPPRGRNDLLGNCIVVDPSARSTCHNSHTASGAPKSP